MVESQRPTRTPTKLEQIKASAAPRADDAKHLAWLRDQLDDRFVAGVILHTGPKVYRLGDRIQAVPICCLWAQS